MTSSQRLLLLQLADGSVYVSGRQLGVARRLAKAKLAVVTDMVAGRRSASITPIGRRALLAPSEQLAAHVAAIAQGVINIREGLTTIEIDSRVYRAMCDLVQAHANGQLVMRAS